MVSPEELARTCKAWVFVAIGMAKFRTMALGIGSHRTELVYREWLAMHANPLLPVYGRTSIIAFYQNVAE